MVRENYGRRRRRLEQLSIAACLLIAGCSSDPTPAVEVGDQQTTEVVSTSDGQLFRLDLPVIDDNVRNDTLLINTTHALNDGTFIMAARNITETFEGLRLYHYELLPDSNARILATSPPAYDSWRLLPTFFAPAQDALPTYILAEFGEKESWGSKLLRLGSDGFTDMGYLDVAYRDRTTDEITGKPRTILRTASDRVILNSPKYGELIIGFEGDSIFLFDDGKGNVDQNMAALQVHYLHDGDTLLLLLGDASS